MMGVAGNGWALLLPVMAPQSKTRCLKTVMLNTFRAFNPTQAEETYSMVTANRFWSQIFWDSLL